MEPLNERSKQVRRDTLKLSKPNGGYHYGGSFSAVEILIELYDNILRAEDKFILSKGHACWPLYVLLREKGKNPKLGGHPTLDPTNGIHFTTGSEGHGMPAGIGMALAKKLQGLPGHIYVLMGDGEIQEGQIWEAAMAAAHYQLDNLCGILDYNGLQIDGRVNHIMNIEPIADKWASFGWEVFNINGHDFGEIINGLDKAEAVKQKPSLLIAKTIKGKGVSFFENKVEYHGVAPTSEELEKALVELKLAFEERSESCQS